MRNILIILAVALGGIALSIVLHPNNESMKAGMQDTSKKETAAAPPPSKTSSASSEKFTPPMQGAFQVSMDVLNRGQITLEFYPAAAPKTCAAIRSLVDTGFYNGVKFHRVVPGFVVQGGDPASKKFTVDQLSKMSQEDIQSAGLGQGGSGKNIPFENNTLQNVKGTLALALSSPRSATASSQFYINLVSNHPLDGDYCVIGQVVRGMDLVEKIKIGDEISKMQVVPAIR